MGCASCGDNNGRIKHHNQSYNLLHVIRDEITGTAEYVTEEKRLERIAYCNVCSFLVNLTRQCKKCGCFIDVKAKYKKAFCPMSKWSAEQ